MVRTTVVELTVVGGAEVSDADLEELGVRRSTSCTFLEATVRDQAALYGLLQRLAALGLELIALRTAPAGVRSEVEVVVRGALGGLVRSMLRDVSASSPANVTAYRMRDGDTGDVLAAAGQGTRAWTVHDGPEMGPVDYLVMEFPQRRLDGEALPLLLEVVQSGVIRVLDLAFVVKDDDGVVSRVPVRNLDVTHGFDVSVLEGSSSGLLDDDDLQHAGSALAAGSAAGVLVYENAWAAPFASAVRRGGGLLVAGGRIPLLALVAAIGAPDGGR